MPSARQTFASKRQFSGEKSLKSSDEQIAVELFSKYDFITCATDAVPSSHAQMAPRSISPFPLEIWCSNDIPALFRYPTPQAPSFSELNSRKLCNAEEPVLGPPACTNKVDFIFFATTPDRLRSAFLNLLPDGIKYQLINDHLLQFAHWSLDTDLPESYCFPIKFSTEFSVSIETNIIR